MLFIEPSDLGVYTASKGYTPADICVALNRSYGASHAFWAYLVITTHRGLRPIGRRSGDN